MATLDQIDIKILQALQNNAKVNMKELSAELNISKTPVYERVKRLEEEGYIRNYVALVDNKKVGLPLVVSATSRWRCTTTSISSGSKRRYKKSTR